MYIYTHTHTRTHTQTHTNTHTHTHTLTHKHTHTHTHIYQVVCGDGTRDSLQDGSRTEMCDDANSRDADGCSAECQVT